MNLPQKECIKKILENEFQKANEYEDFEGTMSYLIDTIKDGYYELEALPQAEANTKDGEENKLNSLTDEDINELLDEYGDLEYVKCVNGELISVDDIEQEADR